MDVNRLYVGASATENVEWHGITIDKVVFFFFYNNDVPQK